MSENIMDYVKHGQAFGPTDSSLIKVSHKNVLKQLFDPQNKIYSALQLNPSIVIGRRGSGKTAYLHHVFLSDQYKIVQEIKTSKTFSQIVGTIEKTIPNYVPAEEVSTLWEELIYLAVMSQVATVFRGESRELDMIRDYMAKENLQVPNGPESFLWKVVKSISAKAGAGIVGAVAEIVKETTGVDFETARDITEKLLEEKNVKAIVLLDSLEQYPTEIPTVANALAGLLKCAGQFNERHENVHLRLCLPAELYHIFLDVVSTNPLKDLSPPNTLTLHWIAGELLSLAAHRLGIYFQAYFPNFDPKAVDYSNREHVREFLLKSLPSVVTNGNGEPEDIFAYLLRHTQLQPRHLLIYLNAIFERQRKLDKSIYPKISEIAVRNGIVETEHLLCDEVFSGFKVLYPKIRTICESCIPQLPLTFSDGELQKVFVRRGKKASGLSDYWDFKRLLIETGIVGRVMGETERYTIGRFEYTEPHKLVVGTDDMLCLHPVFATVYKYKKIAGRKPIYPYGTDIDGEDHREWSRVLNG